MVFKPRFFVAALAAILVVAAPAGGALTVPNPLSPSGDTFAGMPAFAWERVTGAHHYEVQVAADSGFNSPQPTITTKNTRATLTKTLVNGTYWWRARAVDAASSVTGWSTPQSFVLDWGAAPSLVAPASGATVVFPDTPLTLKWGTVPRAAEYRLQVTTDPTLSTPVSSNYPLETQALEFTVPEALAAGTYYWAVTPIDAQGNHGTRSDVRSFVWSWPYAPENPQVTDLDSAAEHFDPLFSWDPVPGAARYELEISSADASGSVVFSGTTIATKFAPKEVFDDNVYNWRVRAVDVGGHRAAWNDGPQFDRAWDKTAPAIQNLRLQDHVTGAAAVDGDGGTAGFQTQVPLLSWDPVPGASSYQVQIAPFSTACNFNSLVFDDQTATNAWVPLGKNPTSPPFPSPSGIGVASTSGQLNAGSSYCVRVRARSGHNGSITIWGGFTYLDDGTGASFTWTGYPATSACSPDCFNGGYLGADDYQLPARATTVTRMPVLTWEPLDGAQSYWVIVAKDANFSTIVDYAFTRLPAYAPRKGFGVRTYSDEQTAYYWAILPSPATNGDFAAFDPLKAAASTFEKHSTPPTAVAPANAASVGDQPVFEWTTAEAARRYRFQVSTDANFSSGDILDDVLTASSAYSAENTYPADTVLWWRVQAQDEENRGLTWSTPRTFEKTLAGPSASVSNPTVGDLIPTFAWEPVQGASSYDVHFQLPDGSGSRDATSVAAAAVTAIKMTGTGHFLWQVRANYPKSFGEVHGPYTPLMDFTRTIHAPTNPAAETGQNTLLLSWDPKTAAKQYKVQVATRTDFSPTVDSATTDNTSYASSLNSSSYTAGGTYYWRTAAVDADNNQGNWTTTRSFTLPPLAAVSGSSTSTPPPSLSHFNRSSTGVPVLRRHRTIRIIVKNSASLAPVSNAAVRVSGAGVTARTKLTGSTGVASFSVRPTRLRHLTFRISKGGYSTAYLSKPVRPS